MHKALGIFLIVYALALWVILLWVWRKGYREWKENRANRIRRFHALVADKREGELVMFEYRNRRQEFKVDHAIYQAVRIGMEGTLFLKGHQFEAFESKSDMERADETYRRMVKG